jgi:hypothetical protein
MQKGQVKNLAGSLPYMVNFLRSNFCISSPVLWIAGKIASHVVAGLADRNRYLLRSTPSGASYFTLQQIINRLG